MDNNLVGDEEKIYRCIFYGDGRKLYSRKEGKLVISSQAFADRGLKPSVDRAKLINYDPSRSQKTPEDGIVGLISKDVRMIDLAQNDSKGQEKYKYKIDVVPRPLSDNEAHAQIEPSPEYEGKGKSVFRRLRERLAIIASEQGWEILPADLRD